MRVSVDALETRNDALRGAGNFAAAMRALEIYYSVGFEPKVLVTVTSQSLPDLEELIWLRILDCGLRIDFIEDKNIPNNETQSETANT